jgi:membrane-associated phospholipid phosphatase
VRKLKGTAFAAASLVLACSALPCRAEDPDLAEGPPAPKAFDSRPAFDAPRDDGRRTMAAFPKNLGRNFVGVFSGQNLLPLAVGAAATATASAFDYRTQDALQGVCSSCGRTGARVGGGTAMVPFVGALFVAGRFSPQGRFRAATYDFAQAMIVNGAYSGLLKYSVKRERPDGSDSLSFPSGHTSTAFSLAAVADQHYGWKVALPAYVLASGIGLSRIEKDKHYLSDVLAGATLGIIVGRTVARLDGDRPAKKRLLSVGPATDPHGQGVGLGLSASW